MRKFAIIADCHFTENSLPSAEEFASFLEDLSGEVASIYFLGDLFQVWIGAARPIPRHVRIVTDALRKLRERKIHTVYIEGNRDYWIRRLNKGTKIFDEVAPGPIEFSYGGLNFYLAHGDRINMGDRPYRLWRLLSKKLMAPAAITLLPGGVALRCAQASERLLSRTNRKHKAFFPTGRCIDFARREIMSGHDAVVVGHFHVNVLIPFDNGKFLLALEDWPAWGSHLVFDDAGNFELRRRGGSRPATPES
jgi:UDP-2,3-diacylglucosamine hydrolase